MPATDLAIFCSATSSKRGGGAGDEVEVEVEEGRATSASRASRMRLSSAQV